MLPIVGALNKPNIKTCTWKNLHHKLHIKVPRYYDSWTCLESSQTYWALHMRTKICLVLAAPLVSDRLDCEVVNLRRERSSSMVLLTPPASLLELSLEAISLLTERLLPLVPPTLLTTEKSSNGAVVCLHGEHSILRETWTHYHYSRRRSMVSFISITSH